MIHDEELSRILEPLEALCGRVVQIEDAWTLLPGWSKLVFRARKKVIAEVRSHYETMGADLSDEEEMRALLKRNPETLLASIAHHDAHTAASI